MVSASQNVYSSRSNPVPIIITVALLGVILSVWAVWALDFKWAVFTVMGVLFPFAMAIVGKARRFVLALLVFTIPLNIDYNILFHPSPGGANAFTIGLTDIFLFVLICITLVNLLKYKHELYFSFFPAISLPVLGLFVFYLISMINSRDLLWSAFDMFSLFKVWLFFLFVANNLENKSDVKLVIAALSFGLLLQAFFVTLQFFNGQSMLNMLGLGASSKMLAFEMQSSMVNRPGGTVGHCNHLARYIGLLLPLTLVLALVSYRRSWRWFMSIVTLAGVIAMIFTLTRSSWIGLLGSVMVMVPVLFVWRLVNFRTITAMFAVSILFLLVIFAFKDVIWGRITSDDLGSAKTRLTTAKVAFNIIKDHPFIGVGINNYGSVLEQYWDAEDTFTRRAAVHNTYLLYMAEIGLLGFAVYLWLLVAFFARIKTAIKSRIKYFSAVAIGILGSFIGFLIMAFPDKSYKENITLLLVFFALAAIIEGMNRISSQNEMTHVLAER